MRIKVGILPCRSSSVCILTAALCFRNLAHGNNDRQRSMGWNPKHTGSGRGPRRWDRERRAAARCRLGPAQNRRRCASRGSRWRRPEWTAQPVRGIPCDTTCRSSSVGMLRYRASSRGKSTARRTSPDIGPGMRNLFREHRRDNGLRTSETHTKARDPRVGRTQFDRHSPLIVGKSIWRRRRGFGPRSAGKHFKSTNRRLPLVS